jgi:hypothetical protein
VKHRSNVTTITNDVQMKNYAGTSAVSGEPTAAGNISGWNNTPVTDSNALTTYGYFDTVRVVEQTNGADDFVDTVNNQMNMRLRTSVSTRVASGDTRDWDFAMMSVRFLEKTPSQYITMSVSDATVGFGNLTSANARYASGDSLGSIASTTIAHTVSVSTNATDGYALTINGSTLMCESCADMTIYPIGDTAVASMPGTEQFGVRIGTSSGNGVTYTPYKSDLWAFATSSFPDLVATGFGDETSTVYTLKYIANIASHTEAGEYSSVLTYVVTGTF